MIKIRDLVFYYPEQNEFSLNIGHLEIGEGEQCCIVGSSGSGKTTLINLISGIYKPLKGSICIGKIPIKKKNEKTLREFRLKNIGYVFQDFCLLDYCNVKDNILLPYF